MNALNDLVCHDILGVPREPKQHQKAVIASRDDAWMTADEAAAYLGYETRAALYQAVRRGDAVDQK